MMTHVRRPPRRRSSTRRIAAISILVTVCAVVTAVAASIEVNGDAAFAGSYGLRVTPGCGHPFSITLTEPPAATLPDEVTACTTITASGVEIVPPGSIFRAGQGIILGDLLRIADNADFTAIIDLPLRPFAWVQDNSPASETIYRASFYINLDEMHLAETDHVDHFIGHSTNGVEQFRVVLKHNALLTPAENRLVLEARLDAGGYLSTSTLNEELVVESGWNEVVLHWKAAAPGQTNGWFRAELRNIDSAHSHSVDLSCVGDSSHPCLTNATGRIDFVRWGVVDGILEATTGGLLVDQFASWRN